jgi:hypothetical protein
VSTHRPRRSRASLPDSAEQALQSATCSPVELCGEMSERFVSDLRVVPAQRRSTDKVRGTPFTPDCTTLRATSSRARALTRTIERSNDRTIERSLAPSCSVSPFREDDVVQCVLGAAGRELGGGPGVRPHPLRVARRPGAGWRARAVPGVRRPRRNKASRGGSAGEHGDGAFSRAVERPQASLTSARDTIFRRSQALLVGLRPEAISLAASVGVEWWVNQTELAWSGACLLASAVLAGDTHRRTRSLSPPDRLAKEQDAHASRDARMKAKLHEVHEAFKKVWAGIRLRAELFCCWRGCLATSPSAPSRIALANAQAKAKTVSLQQEAAALKLHGACDAPADRIPAGMAFPRTDPIE